MLPRVIYRKRIIHRAQGGTLLVPATNHGLGVDMSAILQLEKDLTAAPGLGLSMAALLQLEQDLTAAPGLGVSMSVVLSAIGSAAIEGQATASNLSGAGSQTINVTTNGVDRIIVLTVVTSDPATLRTVSTVANASGLTWTKRKAMSQTGSLASPNNTRCALEVWWAYAPSQLTANTITVTLNGIAANILLSVFAVSDVSNFAAPWDVNAALPASASNTGQATAQTGAMSTTQAATLGLIFYGSGVTAFIPTPNTGWTQRFRFLGDNTNGSQFIESKPFTSAQSAVTTVMNNGPQINWMIWADALRSN